MVFAGGENDVVFGGKRKARRVKYLMLTRPKDARTSQAHPRPWVPRPVLGAKTLDMDTKGHSQGLCLTLLQPIVVIFKPAFEFVHPELIADGPYAKHQASRQASTKQGC